MDVYIYSGPVMKFGKWIGNWTGETSAVSEKKAKSNLIYQYKTKYGLLPSAKIDLPGKVRLKE